jgi:hypothetical protein
MAEIKKVPNNNKGHRTGATMVDPQLVKWRRENRKTGRTIGKHTEGAKKRNAAAREERAQPEPTKRKFF